MDGPSPSPSANRRFFDFAAAALSIVAGVGCLFLPLLLVAAYRPGGVPTSLAHTGGATVGIAVILRAAARRLFRAAARSAMRASMSALSRASARTFTRRFVRLVMHSLFGIVTRRAVADQAEDAASAAPEPAPASRISSLLALVVSFAALGLSFWGVLQLIDPAQAAAITAEQGLPVFQACLLAAAPILVYALGIYLIARYMGLKIRLAAELDALLLQGYFTGAGSFLPMTTDFEYDGTDAQRARLAGLVLTSMFLIHLALYAASDFLDSYTLRFASAMFLVYCFVYAFPLKPLEGYSLWRYSKIGWCCLFIPIFLAFVFIFPAEFSRVL